MEDYSEIINELPERIESDTDEAAYGHDDGNSTLTRKSYNDTDVYTSGNRGLTEFPKEIFSNKKWKSIRLWRNNITSLPPEIGELTELEELLLTGNRLTTLPSSIANLKKLRILNLGHNKLKKIPDSVFKLKDLAELWLFNNEIESLSHKISNLKKLLVLDLSGNKISEIPESTQELYNLEKLSLKENNLVDLPLEISYQGPRRILNYYASLTKDRVKLYEAKLLIVGNGEVGKTCLQKKIIDADFTLDRYEKSTEGIDIKPWYYTDDSIEKLRINFWDFGGQEIYHSTHQFFLTKRSLYLFIWDARKEDHLMSFDYWLNIINLLSYNSPIIVVQNKIDERIKHIDEKSIIEKYPNIVGFFKVSVKENKGIEDLRKEIINQICSLDHIGTVLPSTWINIRERLEDIGDNYIDIEKYYSICSEFKLDRIKADFLSQYYHDLGVFLHFANNMLLREVLFLKPDWATNAVYKLIDTKSVIQNYGRFTYEDLQEIWREYPQKMYKHLVELMKKFELCFELVGTSDYIVPELLPVEKPEFEWDSDNNLRFEFHYDFMPAGILPRLIVRLHENIFCDKYWKDGVVLSRNKAKALVSCEQINRKIVINVNGENQTELLDIIRWEIDVIHKSMNNPAVTEMIPCNCKICRNNKDKMWFSYEDLKIYLESNIKSIFCTKGKQKIMVGTLIKRYQGEAEYNDDYRMRIDNLTINGGNVNFIDGLNVSNSNSTEGNQLITILQGLDRSAKDILENIKNTNYDHVERDKKGIMKKLDEFIATHILPIGYSMSANALFSLLFG